jgi:hypothetical protein
LRHEETDSRTERPQPIVRVSKKKDNLSGSNRPSRFGPKRLLAITLLLVITPLFAFGLNGPAGLIWAESAAPPVEDRINVAAAENGGLATASSSLNDNYPPGAVIDGDRKGLGWGAGGGWRDATAGSFPDWIQVEFSSSKQIDEINVFTLQDTWWNPAEPTLTMIFGNNGITKFDVQYWNGSNWVTVPGGAVTTNNNKVWRHFTFTPITTDKIRVQINAAKTDSSMVVELEAFGVSLGSDPQPTPEPSPTPDDGLGEILAARNIFLDPWHNVGIGTSNPIFNDDGVTGAFVGRWVAIDGNLPGASAYLGLGGTIPNPGDRVGSLNFYNLAMGGADHRTASIFSFNGPQLGTGNLEFYTAPNFIGPVRRMQIAPTGEIGINHAAGAGTMLQVMGQTSDATSSVLGLHDNSDRPVLIVRSDGQISVDRPGQGIVLKSPNGLVCKKLTIDNLGNLVVQPMITCP